MKEKVEKGKGGMVRKGMEVPITKEGRRPRRTGVKSIALPSQPLRAGMSSEDLFFLFIRRNRENIEIRSISLD